MFFLLICKCANDYAAMCQWWHACLGLPTPALETFREMTWLFPIMVWSVFLI